MGLQCDGCVQEVSPKRSTIFFLDSLCSGQCCYFWIVFLVTSAVLYFMAVAVNFFYGWLASEMVLAVKLVLKLNLLKMQILSSSSKHSQIQIIKNCHFLIFCLKVISVSLCCAIFGAFEWLSGWQCQQNSCSIIKLSSIWNKARNAK